MDVLPQTPQLEVVYTFRVSASGSKTAVGASSTRTTFLTPSSEPGSAWWSMAVTSSMERTTPSPKRNPSASARSSPGVRMVTATLCLTRCSAGPCTSLISSGSSTVTDIALSCHGAVGDDVDLDRGDPGRRIGHGPAEAHLSR